MSINVHRPLPASPLTHGYIRSLPSQVLPVRIKFTEPSRFTRQEFKDECDINVIMRRYQSTGEMPILNQGTAQFLDVSASMQFQDSMNFVADAQSMFNELPSRVRDRFYNDPGQFLDYCSNPDNRIELARMGLLTPEATRELLLKPTPTPTPTPTAKVSDKPSE